MLKIIKKIMLLRYMKLIVTCVNIGMIIFFVVNCVKNNLKNKCVKIVVEQEILSLSINNYIVINGQRIGKRHVI
jgi:hypothetical protein